MDTFDTKIPFELNAVGIPKNQVGYLFGNTTAFFVAVVIISSKLTPGLQRVRLVGMKSVSEHGGGSLVTHW